MFRRIVKGFEKEDFQAIIDLCDHEFGIGYFDQNQLLTISQDLHSHFFTARDSSNNIIGFIWGFAGIPPKVLQQGNLIDEPSVFTLKTIVVHEGFKGKGIGTQLIHRFEEDFKPQVPSKIITIAWKNGDQINVAGLMNKFNFKKGLEISNYWREDSLEKGYNCSGCHKTPCQCSAIIYEKILE